eukprot:CAMPEP_0198201926 /NCGR_PEP_ID=MMETSP1445-20131203/4959_1 /TAXON_ID=36898 /ORGANISM="Pyramimonas sp., Strain CCMP2087" /LENGTH=182 /DNA_ID=CAMNT_0043872589 /DNA_START=272 /DNA_END=820 /DNA_ORIENTATION=-
MTVSITVALVFASTFVQGVLGDVCLPGEDANAECNECICCCSTLPTFLSYAPTGCSCEPEIKLNLLLFLAFIPVIICICVMGSCKWFRCLCFTEVHEAHFGEEEEEQQMQANKSATKQLMERPRDRRESGDSLYSDDSHEMRNPLSEISSDHGTSTSADWMLNYRGNNKSGFVAGQTYHQYS